jgi:hypothetical protein
MTPSIAYGGTARRAIATALVVLCAPALPGAAAGGGRASGTAFRKTLVVRVYNTVGLSRRDLAEADRVAGSILRVSGVDVQWKLCTTSAREAESSSCRQLLGADEVIVRLANAPERMRPGAASLGFAALDTHGRHSVLSTVYMDRVHLVARRAKIDETRLAGRAMAHELGHLLIGTHGHTDHGLMRADWTDASLHSEAVEDWMLSPSDVADIRDMPSAAAVAAGTGGY